MSWVTDPWLTKANDLDRRRPWWGSVTAFANLQSVVRSPGGIPRGGNPNRRNRYDTLPSPELSLGEDNNRNTFHRSFDAGTRSFGDPHDLDMDQPQERPRMKNGPSGKGAVCTCAEHQFYPRLFFAMANFTTHPSFFATYFSSPFASLLGTHLVGSPMVDADLIGPKV